MSLPFTANIRAHFSFEIVFAISPEGSHPRMSIPPQAATTNTDGHLQRPMQAAGEKVSDTADVGNRSGRGRHPFAAAVGLRGIGEPAGNGKGPYIILPGIEYHLESTLYRLTQETLYRHFHIGLSGTYPHFAELNVAQYDLLAVADTDFIGPARSGRLTLSAQLPLDAALQV